MHIGLIGGLGPAATVSYYTRLIAAFKKADLPLSLTIEHADMNALLQRAAEDQRAARRRSSQSTSTASLARAVISH